MAFDAGMTAAVCAELSETAVGTKIEKIYQPSSDEIVLLCRGKGAGRKLLLSASASAARVCMTELSRENPKTPPMFCMQLRKHLTGAVIQAVRMYGFERVIEICCEGGEDKAIEELSLAVNSLFTDERLVIGQDAVISSARQHGALTRCLDFIGLAIESLDLGFSQDAASSDIERALGAISELDGRAVSEEIVSDIFSKFCVGK
jgi:predicted ribosome quality control (RQC) complex YloA/Tae2 family protein